MTIVIEILFKILIYEIVDKFHMAPPICESYQIVGQRFKASVEIQDNVVLGGKIKLYSSTHKKKIEAAQEAAKNAIEHLKNFLDCEVEDFNYHDKELLLSPRPSKLHIG